MPLLSLINSRHRMLPFISLWETTGAAETITLPTPTNYLVDWGDGTITTNTNAHIYADIGQYEIKIKGDINDFSFNNGGDRSKIKDVLNFGRLQIINNIFYGCANLDITAIDIPIVTSAYSMFTSCSSLVFNSSINDWDVSNITSLYFGFINDSLFSISLDKWDVSQVVNMAFCFRNSGFNGNISTWNVSNVLDMNNMFWGSPFNGDVSLWVVSSVTNMSNMFTSSSFNQPLPWDVSGVLNMTAMFQSCAFNQEINSWNVSSVTIMANMFLTSQFNKPLNLWDVSNVTNMNSMFRNCPFNHDISDWDFSSVTNISNFMSLKTSLNYDATYYDNLLIKWDNAVGGLVFANMVDVNIGMGTIKYTAAGAVARASLVSKGFIITDGGQV